MSALSLKLAPAALPSEAERLRAEVRAFIAAERAAGRFDKPTTIGMGFSSDWSQRLGARGWIGMTWPQAWGGQGRSALERYVVTEELLAAAVPVGAHWVADRQSGPVILRFGTDAQKAEYLPRIARGDCFFCIGMSEPNSGSDLVSLQSRAERVPGGWRLNGHKLWTTNAHRVHYMITLARTSPPGDVRHAGLSQFIVDLAAPGVTVRPVINMVGDHDFNEIFLDDVFIPDEGMIGAEGNGWNQVSAELAYERSGPERWLSTFRLLTQLIETLGPDVSGHSRSEIGRLVAQMLALRQMSISIASMLHAGQTPNVQAAIVKDLGTRFEQAMVRTVRDILMAEEISEGPRRDALTALLLSAQLWSPAFTIRGGTVEILRGIIARGLGLR